MHIENQFETIDACRFCFMCRHVCTMGLATGKESDTPRGRALVLFKVLRGHIEYNEDLVRSIYRCCLCGVCQTWCKGDYKPPEAILAARRDIVEMGQEPEAARQIKQNLLETGNPFGLPATERFRDLDLPEASGAADGEVLYYVGCHTAYRRGEIARAMLRIFRQCEIPFRMLDGETSTGAPLSVLGYAAEAKQMAEKLAGEIRKTGCRTVVTACPSSFDALKNDYAAMGVDLGGIEILHATEYLDRLLTEGRLKLTNPLNQAVAILDSDRLGRFNGIFDAPRRLLQAIPGAELKEMSWTGELAHSCAETGGVAGLLDPNVPGPLADRILAEAASTDVSVLATCCPVTKDTLVGQEPKGVEVCDVVEMAAAACCK